MRQYRKHRDVVIEKLQDDSKYRDMYIQSTFEDYEKDKDLESLLLSLRYITEAFDRRNDSNDANFETNR